MKRKRVYFSNIKNICCTYFFSNFLGKAGPFKVPKFDKSLHNGNGDRTGEIVLDNVDLILFEGWFVGLRPLADEKRLDEMIPPINDESDLRFAKDTASLLKEYVSLWDKLDHLMALLP